MSFWKTWLGKAIHHTTGIGKGHSDGGGGGGGYRPPSNPADSVPKECLTDLNFFTTHLSECTPTFDPGNPGTPVIGNPGGGVVPGGPVSSVPEPSAFVLAVIGLVFVMLVRRFQR